MGKSILGFSQHVLRPGGRRVPSHRPWEELKGASGAEPLRGIMD